MVSARATMTGASQGVRERRRARWSRLCAVVGLFAASLGTMTVTGCVGKAARTRSARLVVSARPYAKDIPLPEGFTLVEQSSEDWARGDLRYLRHRYSGRADKAAVRAFYRAQMPLVRWSPTSDGSVHGRYTMGFTRGKERCTVEIHGGAVRSVGRVIIDVLIAPATSSTPAG